MIKATYSDKEFIVDLLCRAFDQYNSINEAVKQNRKREKSIRRLMDYSFETCWLYGEIYFTSDLKGVALLFSPEKKKTMLKSLTRDLSLIFYAINFWRIVKIIRREFLLKKYYSNQLVYIWYLGVEPEFQGQGVGTRLLKEIIQMVDQRNLPIYLETSLLINVSFYKRLNFKVFQKFHFSYTLYMLKREPVSQLSNEEEITSRMPHLEEAS